MKSLWILPALIVLGGGCASVHSFHQEPFDTSKTGTEIAYEGRHSVWLRFDSDTSWVEEVRNRFVAQCPTGAIQGVSSRLSTLNSFLHWDYHLRLAGTCVAR